MEAEANSDPDSPSLATVQYHLAMAYEANDDDQKAREAAERALGQLDQRASALKERGAPVSEPDWAGDARQMLDRLGQG